MFKAFRNTPTGSLIFYRIPPRKGGSQPLTEIGPSERDTNLTHVKVHHHDLNIRSRWRSSPEKLTTAAIQKLSGLGIFTLGELLTQYKQSDVVKAAQIGKCYSFKAEFNKICRALINEAPALIDPNYTPPVIINLGIDTIQLEKDVVDWTSLDKETQDVVREGIRKYIIDNFAALSRNEILQARQAQIDALVKELELAHKAFADIQHLRKHFPRNI